MKTKDKIGLFLAAIATFSGLYLGLLAIQKLDDVTDELKDVRLEYRAQHPDSGSVIIGGSGGGSLR